MRSEEGASTGQTNQAGQCGCGWQFESPTSNSTPPETRETGHGLKKQGSATQMTADWTASVVRALSLALLSAKAGLSGPTLPRWTPCLVWRWRLVTQECTVRTGCRYQQYENLGYSSPSALFFICS